MALVDGMEELWVIPSEVLGGQDGLDELWVAPSKVLGGLCCAAAWVATQSHGCTLWVVVRRFQQICWLVAGCHSWCGR